MSIALFVIVAQMVLEGDRQRPCAALSPNAVVAMVQASPELLRAAGALPDLPPDSARKREAIREFCKQLTTTQSAAWKGLEFVQAPIAAGGELTYVTFGVQRQGVVILLNPIIEGRLQSGIDIVAWNRLVADETDQSLGLVNLDRIQQYGCLLYHALNNNELTRECSATVRAHDTLYDWLLHNYPVTLTIDRGGRIVKYIGHATH